MQWWKTKHGTAGGPASTSPSSDFSASEVLAKTANNPAAKSAAITNHLAYARTAANELQPQLDRSMAKTQPVALDISPPTLRQTVASPQPIGQTAKEHVPPASAANHDNSLDFTTDLPAPGAVPPVLKTTISPSPTPSPAVQPVIEPKTTSQPKAHGLGGLAASYDASATAGFSASKLFAVEVDEVQHDPELEEASIRFANGDDAGAEAGLVEAIDPRGPRHQHEETWLTLFDLYRATAQLDRFESLAIDFASKFNRSSPMWFSMPELVGKLPGSEPVAMPGLKKSDWKSPANFGIQTLAALNAALARTPMPWTMDWTNLQSIEEAVVVPLTKLFLSWAAQPVQLRFGAAQHLEQVLRKSTPSGDRSVDQERWNLLMAYLRVAHRPDEFELAALDFCVTYEVSPPSWESARCEFKLLDAEGNTGVGQTIIGDTVHDSIVSEIGSESGLPSIMTAQLASVELSGQIMGEPKPVLDKLEARLTGADVMIISCAKLIRVDFSAAGSMLNWVTARQAEGRVVKFTDVHRLVAAFFHVIGISEHAKVVTRVD
jgi:ABC-type transporter Mla MlaB component